MDLSPAPLVTFSIALTCIHIYEETDSFDGPLWGPFGRFAGYVVPDWFGWLAFVLGLGATLISISVAGYVFGSTFAMGLLAGARLGDSLFSHLIPTLLAYEVPGLMTVPLMVFEGGIVLATLQADLWGVAAGALAFLLVVPSLSILGRLLGWRRVTDEP